VAIIGIHQVIGVSLAGVGLGLLLAAAPMSAPATAPAGASMPATNTAGFPLEPGTHDPVMTKVGEYYYVFYTGGLVMEMRSKDLLHWEPVGAAGAGPGGAAAQPAGGGGGGGGPGGRGPRTASNALPGLPDWVPQQLPGVRGLWAPDISYHNGKWFLYYAASTFGSNTSGIGLATNKNIDPASPDFKWQDDGVVISSKASDYYNCIDPNAFTDNDGTAWLDFGSFYWNQGGGRSGQPANPEAAVKGGVQIIKLDAATGKVAEGAKPIPIASRAYPERAIEAPFLIRNGDWYYLFVSWDRCCQGVRSTYRVMVGRASKVTGPYVDKEGKDMVQGGGTEVLAGDGKRIIGPGHEGLFRDGEKWLMVHHFYDGNTPNGVSRLQIRPVTFDDKGWPVVGKAINSPG
jgi:arabinan endo-1,5-alpha-L-arabinosidase